MSKLTIKKIENIAFDNRRVTLTDDKHTVVIQSHDPAEKIPYAEGDEVEFTLRPKSEKTPAAPKVTKAPAAAKKVAAKKVK